MKNCALLAAMFLDGVTLKVKEIAVVPPECRFGFS